MNKRLFSIGLIFAFLVVFVSLYPVIFQRSKRDTKENERLNIVLDLCEVQQLYDSGDRDAADEGIELIKESVYELDNDNVIYEYRNNIIQCCLMLVIIFVLFFYIYTAILKPFKNMQKCAEEISYGNYDTSIKLERSAHFGHFIWAFDKMRQEISKARMNEQKAINDNKTVIAALSHDIKTPVASIRAYVEGLESGLASSPEKRERYYSVIMKKCDDLKKYVDDLVLHSLTDLDRLSIKNTEFELCGFIEKTLVDFAAGNKTVNYHKPDYTAWIRADQGRLAQIVGNLIGNSQKYADTDIDVSVVTNKGNAEIHIRDYGPGIPDEDMPFIFEKFYRGHNSSASEGTGLGLYIVKYLTEKMNGSIEIHNCSSGCEAIIIIPVRKSIN